MFHGSPVEPIARSSGSSCRSGQDGPWAMSARTTVGETPSTVVPLRSATAHSRSGSGQSGTPSKKTAVPPLVRAAVMTKEPMIQPMSVSQSTAESWSTPIPWRTSSATLNGRPACVCTHPFGRPVLPEV
jgi:hypothetical protein